MKRIFLLVTGLVLFLTACTVTVTTVTVRVNPNSGLLGPGDSIVLTASLAPSGTTTFSWTASGGELSSTTGESVTYTAPNTAGVYTVTATSSTGISGTSTLTVAEAVSASPDPNNPVLSNQNILAGQEDLFRVNVPSNLSGSAIYFEAQGEGLKITLFDASGNAIAESSSAAYFSKPGSASSLQTQAISVELTCRGPCVIIPNNSGQYFLEVEASQSTSYNLYVFGDVYQDSVDEAGEDCSAPGSSLRTAAININVEGAIETLTDLDCVPASGASKVVLSTGVSTTIEILADIYSSGSLLATISAGPGEDTDTFESLSEGNFEIIVRGNNQAAPAKGSKYTMTIN